MSTRWWVRGTAPVTREASSKAGRPKRRPSMIGVKNAATPVSALSSTGISMKRPRTFSGSRVASSSATLAPSEVPPTTAESRPRWSISFDTWRAKRGIE